MYPAISDLINDIFGTHLTFFLQTYGFFLATSFLLGVLIWRRELKIRERKGLMQPAYKKILVGAPASTWELISTGLIFLIIGYKVAGAVLHYGEFSESPQEYIFSMKGSIAGGMLVSAGFVLYRWYTKKRNRLAEPEWREIAVYPHEHTGNLLLVSAIAGLLGAKLFHNLEHFDLFLADPLGQLFSFTGLTFYGSFIFGITAILIYARRHEIPVLHFLDSASPALVFSYGLGRIGCMLSGDGCWGIVNIHPKPGWLGWLPDWMWSFNFPHNVIGEGIPIDPCTGKYCTVLAQPVYPTSFYDFVIMMIFFVTLLLIRNKVRIPGYMFAIVLVFLGFQRFFLELIRVNVKYNIFGVHITQAEIISLVLVIMGVFCFWYFRKICHAKKKQPG